MDANGVPSNADKGNRASVQFATYIAEALKVEGVSEKLPGQTSGGGFEEAVRSFVDLSLTGLRHIRPGDWVVEKVRRRAAGPLAEFEQYAHLAELKKEIEVNPALEAVLGNIYEIAPDIVVSRTPWKDSEINRHGIFVDSGVAKLTQARAQNWQRPHLHAIVSCKWTLRSDRAQNARSEALNLIRNRKGRLPHIAVVTAEPTPSRLKSLAAGTGDIDCVYHFALDELADAISAQGSLGQIRDLEMMIKGHRLKDISDLPIDLCN